MNLIFKFTIAGITKFELELRNYAQFRNSNNNILPLNIIVLKTLNLQMDPLLAR